MTPFAIVHGAILDDHGHKPKCAPAKPTVRLVPHTAAAATKPERRNRKSWTAANPPMQTNTHQYARFRRA
jgi:hypothetical protein